MRILFVFSYPVRIGGGFKSALAMAKYLGRNGCEIIVAAPGGTTEMIEAFKQAGAEFVTIDSLKKRLPIPTLIGANELARVAREKQVDLIHAQEYPSVPRAYLAAIKAGCRFLVTEPGGFFPYHVPPKNVDNILFSMEQKDVFIKKYPLNEKDLHLIRARIDTDVYHPLPDNPEFIQHYSLPADGLKVCMAIRLEPQKKRWVQGIFDAADQLKHLNEKVHFVVAGEGALQDDFKLQAAQINQTGSPDVSVHFMGPIYGEKDICDFYNYADVVAGNGRGILEAMACRKAVIILGEQGQAEWITSETVEQAAYNNFSGRHFRNHDGTPDELSDLIKTLLDTPDKIGQYADFAYHYIHQELEAGIGAKKLAEVYRKTTQKNIQKRNFLIWYIKAVLNKVMGFKYISRHLRVLI